MAGDYYEELRKFRAGGGTDIDAFLDQHTQPTQTTPGPTAGAVAAPVVQAPPPAPVAPPPAPLMNPSVNAVRAAFQAQDTTPSTGAVGSFPRANPAETRNPITSRNLYPPAADQGRILGTTTPAPTPPPSPVAAAPAAAPPLRPVTPPPTPQPIVAPAQPAVQDADPMRFRLPSEKINNQDFLTGNKIAEVDSPPGAPNYPSSPLGVMKPQPAPSPGTNRGAIASLPRRRNQRKVEVGPSKLFSGAAA